MATPLPCPLCGVELLPVNAHGFHDHPGNSCLFSGFEVSRDDVKKWNERVASAIPTTNPISPSPTDLLFPAALTPPLRRVLGMMLWETGPIAHALRISGQDIARKAEDEQAAVLHWLVGFVLRHGPEWGRHAAAALHELTESTTRTGNADEQATDE